MQCVDDESPRERHHGPDGEDSDKEDEVVRKVATGRRVESLRERRSEFLCDHRPGQSLPCALG